MKSKAAAILQELKERYQRNNSIADLAPTVCGLFGLREPDCCGAAPVAAVMDQAEKITNSGKMEKIVLFCTDAMGDHQRELFPEVFRKIEKIAGLRIPSVSVEPSVTPVCYGSIFSGTAPAIHGIMKYEKPVLKVETIFDLLPQYGKKVAIAAVNNCSIDRIFRERSVDYYSCCSDEIAFERTLEMIRFDRYDLIVSYIIGYDAAQHSTGCASEKAAAEAAKAADRLEILARTMDEFWSRYNRTLVMVPDHGGHQIDEIHGSHGTDLPEDMLVSHYYRIFEKQPIMEQ